MKETSSSESLTQLLRAHREAVEKASRKCLPYRDLDEFSAKLYRTSGTSNLSFSSGSNITFEPHNIYTIEEVSEDSRTSIRKSSQRITSSAEELKDRIERLKRLSTVARNGKRPESRRGSAYAPRPIVPELPVNYHQEIAEKFEIIDRFLNDQMDLKQDSEIGSEIFVLRQFSRSKSPPARNRVIRSLCCSCISRE